MTTQPTTPSPPPIVAELPAKPARTVPTIVRRVAVIAGLALVATAIFRGFFEAAAVMVSAAVLAAAGYAYLAAGNSPLVRSLAAVGLGVMGLTATLTGDFIVGLVFSIPATFLGVREIRRHLTRASGEAEPDNESSEDD